MALRSLCGKIGQPRIPPLYSLLDCKRWQQSAPTVFDKLYVHRLLIAIDASYQQDEKLPSQFSSVVLCLESCSYYRNFSIVIFSKRSKFSYPVSHVACMNKMSFSTTAAQACACCVNRVDVLVFDTQGRRHSLRGKEGQILVDLLAENEEKLGAGDLQSILQNFVSEAVRV